MQNRNKLWNYRNYNTSRNWHFRKVLLSTQQAFPRRSPNSQGQGLRHGHGGVPRWGQGAAHPRPMPWCMVYTKGLWPTVGVAERPSVGSGARGHLLPSPALLFVPQLVSSSTVLFSSPVES